MATDALVGRVLTRPALRIPRPALRIPFQSPFCFSNPSFHSHLPEAFMSKKPRKKAAAKAAPAPESRASEVPVARTKRRKPPPPSDSRAGFALLLGRPNVGKSTLLNRLVGEHLAIVSPRPQTTRTRLLGVVNEPGTQLCLVDAPGVHKAQGPLNRAMVDAAMRAIPDMDLVLYLAEAGWPKDQEPTQGPEGEVILPEGVDPVGPFHRGLLQRLEKEGKPVVLILNKIDLLPRPLLLPVIQAWQSAFDFKTIYPLSALTGANTRGLVRAVREFLPESPPLFAEDVITDQSERQLCAEFIREQVFLQTREEIPYGAAVVIDFFDESERWPEGFEQEADIEGLGLQGLELDGADLDDSEEPEESEDPEESEGSGEAGESQDQAAQEDRGEVETQAAQGEQDEGAALETQAEAQDPAASLDAKLDGDEYDDLDFEAGDFDEDDEESWDEDEGEQEVEEAPRPLRGLVRIHATIVVDRSSHKGIVIGKRGERLRKIATVSRLHIERLLGARVWLETHVKVDPEWTRKRAKIEEFGLGSR